MWLVYITGIVISLIIFSTIKKNIWDEPQAQIKLLISDIEKIKAIHNDELALLQKRLSNLSDINAQIVLPEFSDIIINYTWKELLELQYFKKNITTISSYYFNPNDEKNIKKQMNKRVSDAIVSQYKLKFLEFYNIELKEFFVSGNPEDTTNIQILDSSGKLRNLFEVVDLLNNHKSTAEQLILLKNRIEFLEASKSNLKAIPYMAEIMADYETYGIEKLAKELDWGYSTKRSEKVKDIRKIRNDARALVEKSKEAQYQLVYLLELFPSLEDVIECEFSKLPIIDVDELSEYDSTRDWLTKDEYKLLSESVRNQLALDRYKTSRKKTKWQIGRDYELYVGYKYSQNGFDIDYFGSYMGLEDLGRDLIAKKDEKTLIVQCKFWSSKKQIHEKHITQLYGTMISYCVENNLEKTAVKGILITNISLSDMAKKTAKFLDIDYTEFFETGEYPCIKCNVRYENGTNSKIYHLPFDQQYDATKIKKKDEFYAMTVQEAENAGFRRAFRWFGL